MSKIARVAMVAAAGTIAALSAEAAPLPGFQLAAESPHFTFYSRGQKVDAQKSEACLGRIEALLGETVTGKTEYYRYRSAAELESTTGTFAVGLTFPEIGQIHSTEAYHPHEIVHVVAAKLGNPGVFFQEGLAVALGNDGKWSGKSVDALARPVAKKVGVADLMEGFASLEADVAYPVAGSFVGALIKSHGLPKVAAFFRACGPKGRNVKQAFQATFGQSLEVAGALWAASL